jgi:hypothetical protein
MNPENTKDAGQSSSFQQLAEQKSAGFFADVWDFLTHNKKWWLTPIVVVLLLLGGLIVLSGTAAAPFIYTLF